MDSADSVLLAKSNRVYEVVNEFIYKSLMSGDPVMNCNPVDYSPPGPSVHGILQARILEWVAVPDPGIDLGSLALLVDSLPTELPENQNAGEKNISVQLLSHVQLFETP